MTPSSASETAPPQESAKPNANAGHEDSTRDNARPNTSVTKGVSPPTTQE